MPKFSGEVLKVFSKALPEPDRFENTHKHALQVEIGGEPVWVNFGSNKQETFNVQDDDDNWVILGAGSDVVFKYTVRDGKWYDAKKSDLTIMELVEGKKYEPKAQEKAPTKTASKSQGNTSGQTYAKKDMTGVYTGHAINGAMNFLRNQPVSPKELALVAKHVHLITEEVRAEYKKLYPKVSDYDAGASTGHAVLNILKMDGIELEDVAEKSLRFIQSVVGDVEEFIRSGEKDIEPYVKKSEVKEEKSEKSEAKKTKEVKEEPEEPKTRKPRAKKVVEETPPPPVDESEDDDIFDPFSSTDDPFGD